MDARKSRLINMEPIALSAIVISAGSLIISWLALRDKRDEKEEKEIEELQNKLHDLDTEIKLLKQALINDTFIKQTILKNIDDKIDRIERNL